MVTVSDVRREVMDHWGCNGDPDSLVRDSLNLTPKQELADEDWIEFYNHFIAPSGVVIPQTSGFFKRLFGSDPVVPVPPPAVNTTPPVPAPVPAPAVVAPSGGPYNPEPYYQKPKSFTRSNVLQRTDERLAVQQRNLPHMPSMSERFPVSAQQLPQNNMVLVRPEWDNELYKMNSIRHNHLPGVMLLDRPTYQNLQQCEHVRFPPQQMNRPSNMPIHRNRVQFTQLYGENEQDKINEWMTQNQMQPRDVYNPPWVQHTLQYNPTPQYCDEQYNDENQIMQQMQSMSLQAPSRMYTGGRLNGHDARKEAHAEGKRTLEKEMMRQHRTRY